MGPRSADRGNGAIVFHHHARQITSMGPRSADRGNKSKLRSTGESFPTSMGPRSADRGNVHFENVLAVEIRLQWGRDQLIAEMSHQVRMRWLKRNFNGAAIS